ncbi:MAG: iron-containing redox enzyme family protein [Glaciihabitans sp.]|nr:iron-containing redox enzyme family protein [Glaciihabitans sp.]
MKFDSPQSLANAGDLVGTAPEPRGPVSAHLLGMLSDPPSENVDSDLLLLNAEVVAALTTSTDILTDEDLQLALFVLYSLHYGPATYVRGEWEWHPGLLRTRALIEEDFEPGLRSRVPLPGRLPTSGSAVAELLFEMTAETSGPSLSRWIAKKATDDQLREFLVHRSIYTLKEADPHSWAIPRLHGRAKVALVEIQSDEYGAGRPERMHATIFAGTMKGMGLDPTYGAYLNSVPAITLASMNMMSMFGLHRRLRGAIAGHLAAFEMTSSIPNRQYGNGFRRLGHGPDVTWYFDEHVEADAVHEQIAGRDLAGALAEDEPELLLDILFGAAACLYVDGRVGQHMLECWSHGETSLLHRL